MAANRPLTVAHNLRDDALREAIAAALDRAGAAVQWRLAGVDAAVQWRTDPPDAFLFDMRGAAVMERELLRKVARATDRPPVPAVALCTEAERFLLPVYDAVPCGADAAPDCDRVAQSLTAAGRRAQGWRGLGAPGIGDRRLTDAQSARLADLVSRRCGLVLEHAKPAQVRTCVLQRMHLGAFREFDAYCGWLGREAHNRGELEKLLPGLVVGETSFFRTPAHFEALRNVVIPELVRQHPHGQLRAWSAGCSTGEEAWSLAITLREEVADASPERVAVLATDIDHTALAHARRGVYRAKDVRKVPEALRLHHLLKIGEEYHVDQPVRQLMRFDWFNLNSDWRAWSRRFPDGVDLIFCENVIIYFRKDLIPPLLERFAAVLRPGGYLFLGYSETLYGVDHPFEDVTYGDTFFYRKPAGTALAAAPAAAPQAASPPARRRATRIQRRPSPLPLPAAPPAQAAAAPAEPPAPSALEQAKLDARALLMAGEYDAARAAYAGVLARDPDSRGARLALAFLALKAGDDAQADRLLGEVAQVHPLDPELFYFQGLAAERRGERDAARSLLERALFLDADFVPAHFQLGELAASDARAADAARHFRNAAEAARRTPGGAVVSLEGVYDDDALTDLCERNADALDDAAREDHA
ncbi:MAG: CheR family methyltransferase [Planctomycetota bacterium]|jgi:chemotaxis protein methyltransferase CheR